MYVIAVYDVQQERVDKVCRLLRRYLNWVQNSAFEGELSKSQLESLRFELLDIINPQTDSVYLYILRDAKWMRKEILGQEKGLTENII
ncbi:MAG: CRISPR-associated endonuclease Cas2 [Acidobacteria bacterium]|jgi:CRISPR-associated protein Cas2|nr:MAG: CRISPR-associated endonuclease Cas2 [Acidobacteriota bacterium]GIU82898.1 MAG: CRISPR-associated protein Cas2 [Pyrinomonadaceae bacterium]